ncbi:MAG: nicotinate-nucleotide adenylyltransferase [Limnochordia bacterium]
MLSDSGRKRIGVLGGTFDPIHYGHLMAAEEARELLGLTKVIFVPSGNPPHKSSQDVTDGEQRWAMTVLATQDNPWFTVSRVELDRADVSYTVDTLQLLQEQMPEAELYFITGADMFLELPTWKEPETILRSFHFVAVARPGWRVASLDGRLRVLVERYRCHVHILNIPGIAVSSTEIRDRLRAGRSVRYLVPTPVVSYILQEGLYGAQACQSG